MLDMVLEQTRPYKKIYYEYASEFDSEVREVFFDCIEVPFPGDFPLFKRFQDDGSKARLLKNEIVRYSRQMREHFISKKFGEDLIQDEIQENFWPNTKSCFSDYPHEMVHDVPYILNVSDENVFVSVNGEIDHGVKLCKSGCNSLTIEDKAQDKELSKYIPQAVSQVAYEVIKLRKNIRYVPELYVGLLQNGRSWIGILRRVVDGEVFWTYTEAPHAFEVIDSNVGEVNDDHCEMITRLIERAYCTANQISGAIINPTLRPTTPVYLIREEFDEVNCDDDDDK